jgi:hypothetical protein
MNLLHEPPPGFEGVAKAFAMARLLPASHRMNVQVGLVREGVLFASGQLDGYRQVNFFSEHVRELGWQERLLGGDDDMFGCDMLFLHPADAPHTQEDPSFIRRTPVQLWPERDHAEP